MGNHEPGSGSLGAHTEVWNRSLYLRCLLLEFPFQPSTVVRGTNSITRL